MSADSVISFVFESLPVRGSLIQLSASWQRMQQGHDYTPLVRDTLGHAAAATGLIAQSLKFEGSATLQIQGEGALRMLVIQCSNDLAMRGLASVDDSIPADDFSDFARVAHCAITVDNGDRPYQGIVEIDRRSLAASLRNYFDRSVQVPSHIVLVADGDNACGLLLQQMPDRDPIEEDDWKRLGFVAETLSLSDFDGEAGIQLLRKLFAEDDVRVYEPKVVRFHCPCTNDRAEQTLQLLGRDDLEELLEERGTIEVVCEYCRVQRDFDAVDVSRIFADNVVDGPDSVQ
jgi:molecular chaperone Hsp33